MREANLRIQFHNHELEKTLNQTKSRQPVLDKPISPSVGRNFKISLQASELLVLTHHDSKMMK